MTDTPDADTDASPAADPDPTPSDRTDPTPSDRTDAEPDGGGDAEWDDGIDAEPGEIADADETADVDPDEGGRAGRLRSLLDRAALGAFVFVALVTAIGFYRYTGATVRTWVDPAYQPIVLAAFNLALLFVAVAGVSVQLRRLGED